MDDLKAQLWFIAKWGAVALVALASAFAGGYTCRGPR